MPEVLTNLTRRQGLTALALLGPLGLLAACSTTDEPAAPASGSPGTASPSTADATATEEAGLVAAYDAVLAALPELPAATVAVLTEIRDQHGQHLAALGDPGVPGQPVTVPTSASAALTMLIDAEREAARSRIRACVAADDPELARLLAFIGASESAHVPALREVRA